MYYLYFIGFSSEEPYGLLHRLKQSLFEKIHSGQLDLNVQINIMWLVQAI